MVFPTQPFFSRSVNRFSVSKREDTGTNSAMSPSARQPLPDEMSDRRPYMENTSHAAPEGSPTITVMSDPAHSALDGSLMDALKGGIEELHSAMHLGDGSNFSGSPSLDGDIRVRVGSLY